MVTKPRGTVQPRIHGFPHSPSLPSTCTEPCFSHFAHMLVCARLSQEDRSVFSYWHMTESIREGEGGRDRGLCSCPTRTPHSWRIHTYQSIHNAHMHTSSPLFLPQHTSLVRCAASPRIIRETTTPPHPHPPLPTHRTTPPLPYPSPLRPPPPPPPPCPLPRPSHAGPDLPSSAPAPA